MRPKKRGLMDSAVESVLISGSPSGGHPASTGSCTRTSRAARRSGQSIGPPFSKSPSGGHPASRDPQVVALAQAEPLADLDDPSALHSVRSIAH
jgi:hypothetical protein